MSRLKKHTDTLCKITLTPHTLLYIIGSSASFQFMNVTPYDDKYYIMRVVVKPDDNAAMRTVLRRRIWMPGENSVLF